MENILIGRSKEQEVLLKALHARRPEMVAVIGRRRVGKTFLIQSVYAKTSSFYQKGTAQNSGIQIDLLIDRKDNVINVFELKFYTGLMTLSKSYSEDLRDKITVFKEITQTRKQVFLNLLTIFGLKQNEHSLGLIDKAMTTDVLFAEDE